MIYSSSCPVCKEEVTAQKGIFRGWWVSCQQVGIHPSGFGESKDEAWKDWKREVNKKTKDSSVL